MAERQSRSGGERLQKIGDGGWLVGSARAPPRVNELARRVDLKILALKGIGLAAGDAGRAPATADADIAGPFGGVKDAGPHPPVDDLPRSQRLEDALRRRCYLDGGEDVGTGRFGDDAGMAFGNGVHFP